MDLLLTNVPLLFGKMRNQDINSSFIGVCEVKSLNCKILNRGQFYLRILGLAIKFLGKGTREEHAMMRMVNPRGSF